MLNKGYICPYNCPKEMKTTNYFDTFIAIAADCPTQKGETPPVKKGEKSVAQLQFEMIAEHPYQFTSDEVLFQVFSLRNDLAESEKTAAYEAFFSKGQACFRASPLTKKYGWGIHCNHEGKMALYGCETPAYQDFLQSTAVKTVKAMQSKRDK